MENQEWQAPLPEPGKVSYREYCDVMRNARPGGQCTVSLLDVDVETVHPAKRGLVKCQQEAIFDANRIFNGRN